MSFVSLEYLVFFAAIFLVYWGLRKAHVIRTVLIVVASAWFYTRFDYGPTAPKLIGWIYLAVLSGSAALDFVLAQALYKTDVHPRAKGNPSWVRNRRRTLLIVSVVYNLGVLAFFKYTNFALETVKDVFALGNVIVDVPTLKVILPIGISFFTFETMSYTIDVYRRELIPAKSFLEYLLFISFFPHLVAGPIIRPKDMLPQLRRDPVLSPAQCSAGTFLIAGGLLKKVVIADYLGVNHVDRVFDFPERFSAPEILAGIYGYALQIYCDFSGYTDIALGSALLLGISLPKNFDVPYVSEDLQEFWRRWHISLSSWLRDYLYIPLGGSRGSSLLTYRNLILTMLLGGLWHGPKWTFVVWGALHGGALAATRLFQRWHEDRAKRLVVKSNALEFAAVEAPTQRIGFLARLRQVGARPFRIFLTFHYVCLAWVFFRAETFGAVRKVLHQLWSGPWRLTNLSLPITLALAAGFVSHFMPAKPFDRLRNVFIDLPAPAQAGLLFGVALVIKKVATSQVVPFVYFQF